VFYRPAHELKPGAKYTLTIASGQNGPVTRNSFTVGDSLAKSEAAVDPEITYLKVFTNPACVGEQCFDFAKLRITLGRAPSQPLWLRLQGSYAMGNTNAWTFYPTGWSVQSDQQPELLSEIQLSVPLASDDDCVDMQIYGVEGRALFEARRCEPERCAVYTMVAGRNSGGGPGGTPVDVEQVKDGSCDDPPVLDDGLGDARYPSDAGTPADQTTDHAGPASNVEDADVSVPLDTKRPAAGRAAHGCSVSSPRSMDVSAGWLWALLAIAFGVRRRCRNRCLHRGSGCPTTRHPAAADSAEPSGRRPHAATSAYIRTRI
jgi:hypothetical protein